MRDGHRVDGAIDSFDIDADRSMRHADCADDQPGGICEVEMKRGDHGRMGDAWFPCAVRGETPIARRSRGIT